MGSSSIRFEVQRPPPPAYGDEDNAENKQQNQRGLQGQRQHKGIPHKLGNMPLDRGLQQQVTLAKDIEQHLAEWHKLQFPARNRMRDIKNADRKARNQGQVASKADQKGKHVELSPEHMPDSTARSGVCFSEYGPALLFVKGSGPI
jgi:hypothetical protein